MHGHHCGRGPWQMAGRFGGRGGFGGFGPGMRGGRGGGGDMFRAGRLLGDGDLKLITLALLAQAPRHGYDIIKALEERSNGFYSPSPGVVYPTLTYLEEAGHAVSAAEGNKKVFSITEAGAAYLKDNRDTADRVLEQIERFGRKMAKAREWFGSDDMDDVPPGGRSGRGEAFRALRHRLRAALGHLMEAPGERRDEAIAILERAVEAIEALTRR